MAGGPGSGKSYMARQLLGGSGLKAVNTDQALEYLMAKHDLDPTMPDEEQEQRDVQRGRAKEITSKRRDNYVDGRLGLIIDGTGKDSSKIQKTKQELEDIGYETRMIFVDATLDTAQQRNMKRPERSVPLKLLNRLWTMSQENIPALKTLFGGNFSKVNNNEQISQEDKKLHQQVYNNTKRWLERPVTNREALDWMDQQTGFSEGLATITEDACGDCFSKAGRALIDTEEKLQDNTTLVHALVRGQGKLEGRRFPHAWIEMGDVVFDNANGNNIVMRKEQYYKLGGVEEAKGAFARYEHYKGLSNMLKHGHWGPWDLDDSLNEETPEHSSSIANAITEKFASDAQRRGFFKHKDKKKKVTETDRVTIADPRVKSGTTVDPTAPKVSVSKSDLIQRTEKQKKIAAKRPKNPNKDKLSGVWKDKTTGLYKTEPSGVTVYGTKGQPGYKKVHTGPDRKGLADQRRDKEAETGKSKYYDRNIIGQKHAVYDVDRELKDTELRRGLVRQNIDQMKADDYVEKGDPRDKRLEVSVERDKDGKKVRKEVWQSDIDAKRKKEDASQKKWEEKYGNYGDQLAKKRILQDYIKQDPTNKRLQAKLTAHLKDMDRTKIDSNRKSMELYRKSTNPTVKNSFLANPFAGTGDNAPSRLARNPEYARELYQFAKETGNKKQMEYLSKLGYGVTPDSA